MKLLNRIIDKIGVDKMLHFAFGGWITAKFMETGNIMIGVCGILFCGFISIIKEKFLDEQCDWLDIAAAMLGGVLEFVTYYLITIII